MRRSANKKVQSGAPSTRLGRYLGKPGTARTLYRLRTFELRTHTLQKTFGLSAGRLSPGQGTASGRPQVPGPPSYPSPTRLPPPISGRFLSSPSEMGVQRSDPNLKASRENVSKQRLENSIRALFVRLLQKGVSCPGHEGSLHWREKNLRFPRTSVQLFIKCIHKMSHIEEQSAPRKISFLKSQVSQKNKKKKWRSTLVSLSGLRKKDSCHAPFILKLKTHQN